MIIVNTNETCIRSDSWNGLPPVRFSWSNTELFGTITAISPDKVCTVRYEAVSGFAGGVTDVPLRRILSLNPTIDLGSFGIQQQTDQRIASGSEGVKRMLRERMK